MDETEIFPLFFKISCVHSVIISVLLLLLYRMDSQHSPTLLFLGSDAHKRASEKIAQLSQQIEEWENLSISTDFER